MIQSAVSIFLTLSMTGICRAEEVQLSAVEFAEASTRLSLSSDAFAAAGVGGESARQCWELMIAQDEMWDRMVALDAEIIATNSQLKLLALGDLSEGAAASRSEELQDQIVQYKDELVILERAMFEEVVFSLSEQSKSTLRVIYNNRMRHIPMPLRVIEWTDVEIQKYREQNSEQIRVEQLCDANLAVVEVSFFETVWADSRVQSAKIAIAVRKVEIAVVWRSVFQTLTF